MSLSLIPEEEPEPIGRSSAPISEKQRLEKVDLSGASLQEKTERVAGQVIQPLPVTQQDIQANREIVQKKSFDDISHIHAALSVLLTYDIENTELNIPENVRDALLNDKNSVKFILEKLKANPMKMIPWGFKNGFFDKIVNNLNDSEEKQTITAALHEYLKTWLERGTVRDVEFLDSITDLTLLKELCRTVEKAIDASANPQQKQMRQKKYNSLLEQTNSASVLAAARDVADEMLTARLLLKFKTFPANKKTLIEEERTEIIADFQSIYESGLGRIYQVIEAAKKTLIPSLKYFGTFPKYNIQENLEAMSDIDELENMRRKGSSVACQDWFSSLAGRDPTLNELGYFFTMQAPEQITKHLLDNCKQGGDAWNKKIVQEYEKIMKTSNKSQETPSQEVLYRAYKKIITDDVLQRAVHDLPLFVQGITDMTLLKITLSAMRMSTNAGIRKIPKSFVGKRPTRASLLAAIQDTINHSLDTQNFSVLELREYLYANNNPANINFAWQQMKTSTNPLVKQIASTIEQATRGIQITMQTLLASIDNSLKTPLLQANFTAASLAAFVEAFPEPSNLNLAYDSMVTSQDPLIQEMLRAVRAAGTILSLPKVVEETMKKFELEMEDLRTTIIACKRGPLCFADIEQFIKIEKRYHYASSDEDIQKLFANISEKGLDPLVTRFHGVKTHARFIEVFETAKTDRAHEINAKLGQSEGPLKAEEVALLVGMGPNNDQAHQIIIRAAQSIQDRVKQIQKATQEGFETKPISESQALRVAVYIEQKKAEFENINAVFKRRACRLPFTLQVTKEGVFLIARKKFSKISGEGTYKIARATAGIPLNPIQILGLAVRVFTKPEAASKQTIREAIEEAKIALHYSGRKGFARVYGYFVYTFSPSGANPIVRIAIVSEQYKGDLDHHYDLLQTDSNKLHVCDDLLGAVSDMHHNNQVLGDAKFANYLVRINAQGNAELAVTDFGFTRTMEKQKGSAATFIPFDYGWYTLGSYGTFRGPPWFVGKRNYKGDPRVIESYVIGTDLWNIFYGPGSAPASKAIQDTLMKKKPIDDPQRTAWRDEIAQAIAQKRKDERLENVKFEDITDPVKRMKYLMFELMDPNEKPNGTEHMTIMKANELLHPPTPKK